MYMSSKEIWIVIIMRLLKNLEMKRSLFTLIMEEGKTLFSFFLTVNEKSFLNSLLLMCLCISEALSYKCHFSLICLLIFSFGKHSHDELSILVPLSQCCRSVLALALAFIIQYLSYHGKNLHELFRSRLSNLMCKCDCGV